MGKGIIIGIIIGIALSYFIGYTYLQGIKTGTQV